MDADSFEPPDGVALGEPASGSRFGRLGLIASILGLIVAVAHPYMDTTLGPIPAPLAKFGDQVGAAADQVVRRTVANLFSAEPPPARKVPAEGPSTEKTRKAGERVVVAGHKLVDWATGRVRSRPAQPPVRGVPVRRYLAVVPPGLGLLGALVGLVGYVRREETRPAAAAMAVGFLAVAWTYILVALVIALVIVAVVLILRHLG